MPLVRIVDCLPNIEAMRFRIREKVELFMAVSPVTIAGGAIGGAFGIFGLDIMLVAASFPGFSQNGLLGAAGESLEGAFGETGIGIAEVVWPWCLHRLVRLPTPVSGA
jgi:hypothetical protein